MSDKMVQNKNKKKTSNKTGTIMEPGIKFIFTLENRWLKQNAVKEDNYSVDELVRAGYFYDLNCEMQACNLSQFQQSLAVFPYFKNDDLQFDFHSFLMYFMLVDLASTSLILLSWSHYNFYWHYPYTCKFYWSSTTLLQMAGHLNLPLWSWCNSCCFRFLSRLLPCWLDLHVTVMWRNLSTLLLIVEAWVHSTNFVLLPLFVDQCFVLTY